MSLKSIFNFFLTLIVISNQMVASEGSVDEGFFPPIVLSVSSVSGNQGDVVCVDISATNFTNIEGFQFSINYNTNILDVVCPVDESNAQVDETGLDFNCGSDDGNIWVFWTDPNISSGVGATVPDGETIFSVCFTITGACGLSSPITISGIPLFIEINQIRPGEPGCENLNVSSTSGLLEVSCTEMIINSSKCDASESGDDGSLSFYIAGGSGSYTYTVSPGGFSGTTTEAENVSIQPLTTGNYTITATDINTGEILIENVLISDNFPLEVILVATDPYCWNRDRGHIESTVLRGGFPVGATYEWSNFQFTPDIEKLGSGTYSLTVTDFTGCTAEASATLFVDTLRVFAELIDSASCESNNDAVVKVWATGGTPFTGGAFPAYDYETSSGNDGPLDTFFLNNVETGLFTYMAIDNAVPFCGTEELTLDIPFKIKNLALDIEVTQISCEGIDDGMAIITASGSTNFGFQVRNENNMLMPSAGTPTMLFVNDLPEGCYYVLATESFDGCQIRDTFCIIDPDSFSITADQVTNPSCIGNDGSILISTIGGIAPFEYLWNDGPMTEDRTGLSGGTYAITVTDGGGCSDELSFILPSGEDVMITASVIQAINCPQDMNGTVEVNLSVTGNFVYNWETPDGTFISDMQTVNSLGSGTYYVTATDASAGCSAIDTVVLAAASPITIAGVFQEPTCPGVPNGSISITPIEGTLPFTYEWENGSTLQILSGITEGTYSVTITDDNLCIQDTFLTLTAPDGIQVDISNINGVNCFGSNNGTATAIASGGPGGASIYTYFWSNNPTMGNAVIVSTQTNLLAGDNWVIAADMLCSSDTVFFSIPDIDSIEVNPLLSSINSPTCNGDCNGSITAVASGGNSVNYNYLWTDSGTTNNTLAGLCAGDYEIMITDANNCQVTRTIPLTEPDSLSVSINSQLTQEVSCDEDNGRITVNVSGGSSPFIYNWTDGISDTNSASDLGPGTYVIDIIDNNGCTASTNYSLVAPEPVVAIIGDIAEPDCYGDLTCISIASVTGGIGNAYTFTINNGGRFPIDSCVAVYANEYLITVVDSSGNCSYTETIFIDQPNEILVDAGPDQEINLGESSEPIMPIIVADNNIVNLAWTPLDSVQCLDIDCQDIIASPTSDQLYTFTVADENGCTASDDILITVNTRRNVYIPNIFTPNEDGVNDYFNIVIGSGAVSVSYLSIFDRWGNKVYDVETEYIPEQIISDGWDGKFNGKYVNPGVYIYMARVNFIDGKTLDYSGDITVIR